MRLNRLHLVGYGLFTDVTLDFGSPPDAKSDLHVVYGPNEAGKSTAFSAWLEFLYGIRPRSPYKYQHKTATRIAAVLDGPTQELDLERTTARINSLQFRNGTGNAEIELRKYLSGLDRDGYESVFSVNVHTLQKGGDEILASKGDLGTLLFSASAGLPDLTARLESFKQVAEEFYKPRARKKRINELKRGMDDLRIQWRRLDTEAAAYQQIRDNLTEAERRLVRAREVQRTAQLALNQKQKVLDQIPHALRVDQIRRELFPLSDLEPPPGHWRPRIESLTERYSRNQARRSQAGREVDRLEAARNSITLDKTALLIHPQVQQVANSKSSFDEAVKDLPRREQQAKEVGTEIDALAARLRVDVAEVSAVLPEAGILSTIRDLIESHSGVQKMYVVKVEEAQRADKDIEQLKKGLGTVSFDSSHARVVETLLSGVLKSDPRQLLQTKRDRLTDARGEFRKCIDALEPWKGDSQQLIALDVPPAGHVLRWKSEQETAKRNLELSRREVTSLQESLADTEEKLAKLASSSEVTLAEIAEARELREYRWSRHLQDLAIESAKAFETAMRRDDVVGQHATGARLVEARSKDHTSALSELRRKLTDGQSAQRKAASAAEAVEERLAHLSAGISGHHGEAMSCDEAIAWLEGRIKAIGAWRNVEIFQSHVTTAQKQVEKLQADLTQALANTGMAVETASLEILLGVADDLVKRFQKAEELRRLLADRQRERARRRVELERSEAAWNEWQMNWKKACSQTMFSQAGVPNVAFMREVVDILVRLDRKLAEQRGLIDRINKMTENRDAFVRSVQDFGRQLGLESGAPLRNWQLITDRTTTATNDKRRLDQIEQDLEERTREVETLEDDAATLADEMSLLGRPYGVKELDQLRQKLNAAEKAQNLRDREAETFASIRMILPDMSIKDLLALDRNEIELERAELRDHLDQRNKEVETQSSQVQAAREELNRIAGSSEVALLKEQHSNLLLEVREGAVQHLRKQLGAIAVEQAIIRYRDQHRSGMLAKAQQVFSQICGGAYLGLTTVVSGNRVELCVRPASGGSKTVDELSDGTRCQLYLALRIAGYHEITQKLEALPFIADDVLESFDDDRTAQTFAVLEDMAQTGQVVYMTHHRHLCDVAQRVCKNVTIHAL